MMSGYLVTFQSKDSFFGKYGNEQQVLCNQAHLIELLQKASTHHVLSAVWVDVREYFLEHPDKQIDMIGIEK